MKRLISIIALFLLLNAMIPTSLVFASPGLTVSDLGSGMTPEDMVEMLLGPGIEIDNVTYTGANESAGSFSGGMDIIGFESGIILSSGYISYVVGPNSEDDKTANLGLIGDSDLDTLIPGYDTYDAVILEFDFKPAGDTLTFDYVFGSEEYNEYTNSEFNDVFGFFLEGTNVALLPDGVTPVAINNVNGGNPYGSNSSNPEYYRNNDLSDGGGSIDTELDGLTTVLSVNAAVTPGEWHHIKLGIADAGDEILDSDVFIRAGSFVSIPDLYLEPNEATNYIGELHTLTATYTVDDEPVPGISIHFEAISGPHSGTNGDSVTDASGIATWSYTGTSAGTDTIIASLTQDPEIVSNTVTKIWQENGPDPEPGPEVGGDIYNVNKLVMLSPWIIFIALIAAGIIIAVKRYRIHS